jgi:hypothetical protein
MPRNRNKPDFFFTAGELHALQKGKKITFKVKPEWVYKGTITFKICPCCRGFKVYEKPKARPRKIPSIPYREGDWVKLAAPQKPFRKGETALITDIELERAADANELYIRVLVGGKKNNWTWVNEKQIRGY